MALGPGKEGGETLIKKNGVLHAPFRVKTVLEPLRVFDLKRSTAEAFAVTFRELSQKNITGHNVLFQNWYLLGMKKIQASPTNRPLSSFIWESAPLGSWKLLI